MKRWRFLAVGALLVGLAGCEHPVTDQDFNDHVADYSQLRTEFEFLRTNLGTWSAQVYSWQQRTFVVICDIAAKNPPMSKYASETQTYCGTGEGTGEPEEPPDWGPPQE